MKQVYLLPNIVTAFALSCGLYVILKTNLVGEGISIYDILHASSILILIAAFADYLDGAIARAIHAESEFGFIFDSMSDGITFGVAPAVLLIRAISPEQGSGLSFFVIIGAMLYALLGVLRLVRFNVKTSQIKMDEAAKLAAKKSFTGLPIPAAAIAALSTNLFLHSPLGEKVFLYSDFSRAIILTSLTLIIGFLMVSKLKFPSLKALHFRVPSLYLLIGTVVIAIFALYGILHQFSLVLFVISWSYIIIALILLLIHYIIGKRSQALKDFDPESDDL